MNKRYESFREIAASWEGNQTPALLFAAEDGSKEPAALSYDALRTQILAEEARHRAEAGESGVPEAFVLSAPQGCGPDVLVTLFARVMAGGDVIMADPMMPKEALEKARQGLALDLRGREPGGEGRICFFTSGTTSQSRCVILTSRALSICAWSGQSMLPCAPGDIMLSILPLSHVFGFVCSMLWGLCYGAAVALGRGPRHFMDDPAFFRPTILPAVPTIVAMLERFGLLNPELAVILIGAAPCEPALAARIQARGIRVYLGYGLTETASGLAITQDQDDLFAAAPCPGADIRVDEDGEISVATPSMMEGYLGEPSPLRDGRFYTGDIGWFDERGWLHLSGRRKDVLVLPDGTKIFCPEYEKTLTEALGTGELAVAARQGRAVLILGADAEVDDPRVMTALDAFNASKDRSRQITDVIRLDRKLPRTAVGKLQRWKLDEYIAQ